MGALFAIGLELFLGLVLGGIITIIGLFFGHIILFDSIALALLSGFLSHGLLNIHTAISLIIGIVVFFLLFFLQHTKVGFWIIGGLLSLFWGFVFSIFAYDISGKDMIWTYVVLGLGTLLMLCLHIHARNKTDEI